MSKSELLTAMADATRARADNARLRAENDRLRNELIACGENAAIAYDRWQAMLFEMRHAIERYNIIRPIKTEQDYAAALARVEALIDSKPGTPECDELEVLAVLIQDYEKDDFTMSDANYQDMWQQCVARSESLRAENAQLQLDVVAAREWAHAYRAAIERKDRALERVLHSFQLAIGRKPVRDATETIAEARAALGNVREGRP